jgi:coproporphyrinogen III oxidase-like Fe-S oxidoreductase
MDLNKVMTSREAEERFGLEKGTVRSSCVRGRLKKYIEKGLVRKSGGTWLVTEEAMAILYLVENDLSVQSP